MLRSNMAQTPRGTRVRDALVVSSFRAVSDSNNSRFRIAHVSVGTAGVMSQYVEDEELCAVVCVTVR